MSTGLQEFDFKNMGRAIKFRAWDPINNLMHGWDYLKTWTFADIERSGVTVMQFSGLLDENGKEIYEGDRVTFEGEVYLVRSIPAGLGLVGEANSTNIHLTCNGKYFSKRIEVIGNVHEVL